MPHGKGLYEGNRGNSRRAVYQAAFSQQCLAYAIPIPQFEYHFALPRRWALDYAWPDLGVAIEQDGGIWIGGGHNRGVVMTANMEKLNTAALLGWKVFRFTPQQIKKADWVEWFLAVASCRKDGVNPFMLAAPPARPYGGPTKKSASSASPPRNTSR